MEDARRVLADVEAAAKRAPKIRRARAERAGEVARKAAVARAPVETGRLRAGLVGRYNQQRDAVELEFPGNYVPLVTGVPSRGIAPHDFADRGLEAAGDEMEAVLDDLLDAFMGRG